MNDVSLEPLPFLTAEVAGIGGRIKGEPEDFEVEEIPAYEPSGSGEFLYLWVQKRDWGAEYFLRQIARRLRLRPEDIGMAGLKDRRAVTRQWISVPLSAEPALDALTGDGIELLQVHRHTNKLKPGHLRGNRFRIRVRDVATDVSQRLDPVIEGIQQHGLPNFYGPQRFGIGGETLRLGLDLLRGRDTLGRRKFLRKLALSAAQSWLFNSYLASRMRADLLSRVLAGDVLGKWPHGGMFVAQDVPAEQARFDRREVVTTGPMFGRKMLPAIGDAAEREAAALHEAGLSPANFQGFGKLLQGTRRHNLVYIDDLAAHADGVDVILTFSLPSGSYATILLREIMKTDEVEGDQSQDSEISPPA